MRHDDNPRAGFDYWLSFPGQGDYNDPKRNENGRRFQATGYMTDILTDYAVDYPRKARDKPFCLYLSHKAVHGDFIPAERHKGLYANMNTSSRIGRRVCPPWWAYARRIGNI